MVYSYLFTKTNNKTNKNKNQAYKRGVPHDKYKITSAQPWASRSWRPTLQSRYPPYLKLKVTTLLI